MIKLKTEARYCEQLESLLNKLGAIKILKEDGEADYSGQVSVDALLSDGRVFSYEYYYGSCSGCDEWEDLELIDEKIEETMAKEATFFANEEEYKTYLANCAKKQ